MRVLLLAAFLSSTALAGWQYVSRSGAKYYGNRFSEENGGWGPSAPQTGFVGFKCHGSYCDDKTMRITNVGENVLTGGDIAGPSNISEEGGRSNMNCGGRLLSRLRCRGGHCDNTDTWCRNLKTNYQVDTNTQYYTGWFSEENPAKDCNTDYFLWGLQCRDSNCDGMRLRCVKVRKYVPNNCAVSGWTAWGQCSKQCGSGTQKRTRSVTTQPEGGLNGQPGGQACPELEQTRACNTQACPINCAVSAWGAWSDCSKTCGTGTQKQTRTVTTQPQHNGNACPSLEQSRNCNTDACPVDCVVSEYGEWGECDAECDGGKQTRTRSVTRAAADGGVACPDLSEEQDCNTQSCRDCDGIENKLDGTYIKVKKAISKKAKLVDKEADPLCECADLCKADNSMSAAYYSYYIKKDKPTCMCYEAGSLKMKARNGYQSGYLNDAGKKQFDKKSRRKSRRRRRRRN